MRGVLLIVLIFLTAGCETRTWNCGAGSYEPTPLVTLESVTETKESQARGRPILALPLPAFPPQMKHAGITGEVTARLTIAPDGSVQQCAILRSSQREFESCVRAATSHWIFRPLPDASSAPGQSLILDCQIKFGFASE